MGNMSKEHYDAWREGYDWGMKEWRWRQKNGLPSKSEEIRQKLLADPDYPPARLAEEIGCTRALVHLQIKKLARERTANGANFLPARGAECKPENEGKENQ
jgi:hypothetical protein